MLEKEHELWGHMNCPAILGFLSNSRGALGKSLTLPWPLVCAPCGLFPEPMKRQEGQGAASRQSSGASPSPGHCPLHQLPPRRGPSAPQSSPRSHAALTPNPPSVLRSNGQRPRAPRPRCGSPGAGPALPAGPGTGLRAWVRQNSLLSVGAPRSRFLVGPPSSWKSPRGPCPLRGPLTHPSSLSAEPLTPGPAPRWDRGALSLHLAVPGRPCLPPGVLRAPTSRGPRSRGGRAVPSLSCRPGPGPG